MLDQPSVSPPEDQPEQVEKDQEVLESSVSFKPVTIHDGKCEHNFLYDYTDSENKKHYQCSKCPMGAWNLEG